MSESFRIDFHYIYKCFCNFALARLRARRAHRKATIVQADVFTLQKSYFLKSENAWQSAKNFNFADKAPLSNHIKCCVSATVRAQ